MVAPYPSGSPHVLAVSAQSVPAQGIKILDLLTNRYHAGIVQAALADGLQIEVPGSARLSAGQRVQFALDDASGIVPRQTMRSALIRGVHRTLGARLRIELATAECLAA